MASYQQVNYCKKCQTNVSLDSDGHCKRCGGNQIKRDWTVRFRFSDLFGTESHKRLTGFKTKKEAQQGYIDFINNSRIELETKSNKKLLFNELYNEFKSFTKSRIKESSYYDFCSKSDIHILPYFKDYEVDKITPKVLLAWQDKLKEYSFKYKTNLRSHLNQILNYAQKYYSIPNRLKEVDAFRNVERKKEMQFYTLNEFNSFISAFTNEIYKTFFYCLYYTGARKGELLASTWEDWDLNNSVFHINKNITKKIYGAKYKITTPKNQSSNRDVSLPNFLVDIMKNFKKGREQHKFVFYDNKPLADTSIIRAETNACKKAGVKRIRLHDFRHSHASLLLSQGISVVAVAKRLGHSNIEQTLNTYAHLMPKEADLILKVLENL